MNQANITAIASAVAAAVLLVIQSMQGTKINDNHETVHERINGVENTVMNKETIAAHVASFDKQQAVQDQRLDDLETEYPLHMHEDEED